MKSKQNLKMSHLGHKYQPSLNCVQLALSSKLTQETEQTDRKFSKWFQLGYTHTLSMLFHSFKLVKVAADAEQM